MPTQELGRIEIVDVGSLWEWDWEAFVIWLSEKDNLDKLGEVLRLKLEPPDSRFGSTILTKESGNNTRVVIVGMPHESNHNALGYLPGYAAKHCARILIVVSPKFRDGHSKALEWLNRVTTEEIEVYGVEVRALRIGDSLPAPEFRVVVGPEKEGDRGVAEHDEEEDQDTVQHDGLTPLGRFRREFWTYYAERYPHDGVRSGHAGSNVYHKVEEAATQVSQYLAQGGVGCYIARWMRGESKKSVLAQIEKYKPALSASGLNLVEEGSNESQWDSGRGRFVKIDCNDRENWPQMADWLHEKLHAYRQILLTDVSQATLSIGSRLHNCSVLMRGMAHAPLVDARFRGYDGGIWLELVERFPRRRESIPDRTQTWHNTEESPWT